MRDEDAKSSGFVKPRINLPEPTEIQILELEYNALIQAHLLLAKLSRLPADSPSTLKLRDKIELFLRNGAEKPPIPGKHRVNV